MLAWGWTDIDHPPPTYISDHTVPVVPAHTESSTNPYRLMLVLVAWDGVTWTYPLG